MDGLFFFGSLIFTRAGSTKDLKYIFHQGEEGGN